MARFPQKFVVIGGKSFTDSGIKVSKALLSLYGLGNYKVNRVLAVMGITNRARIYHLSSRKLAILNFYLKFYIFGEDMQELENYYLRNICISNCYRSFRYLYGLPANGQRTHGNSKTSRSKIGKSYRNY